MGMNYTTNLNVELLFVNSNCWTVRLLILESELIEQNDSIESALFDHQPTRQE